MSDEKAKSLAARIIIWSFVAPIVIGAGVTVINCGSKLWNRHKIKQRLKRGEICLVDGNYYQLDPENGITEEAIRKALEEESKDPFGIGEVDKLFDQLKGGE